MIKKWKYFLIAITAINISLYSSAQDSTKRRTIDITSTFKPVLRDPSKLNFQASPVNADTTPPKLAYNIPAENLLFKYQPVELKPVSLDPDSSADWGYSNFIKLGIGNVHQPYVKAGFSFGDGENTFFNIFADHYTSKGHLPFQKNSLSKVGAMVTYKTPTSLEWTAGLGFTSDDYYLYGFRPDTLNFTKNQLKQRFQTIEGRVSLRNIEPTDFGLSYNPSARVSVFTDNHKPDASEANSVVTLPVQKNFGKSTAFNLGVTADLTNYRNEALSKKTDNNNIFLINPSVLLKTPNLYLQAGITPSWDNGNFHMLPNAMADITTDDQRFTLQLGWIGYYNKGSYQRFASINPWLARPDSLLNTRVQEGYVGFKGSIFDHLSYSAKIGFQQHRNMPLFVNDNKDGKTFVILYEDKLNIFQTHAEAEYRFGEKFSAKGTFNWNIFNMQSQERAWGLIPLELTTGLRWQVMRDLFVRADLWTWDGAKYRGKNGESFKGETGFDLNAGAEFKINRNFSVWLQMNNIMNNRYERWHQYEVFGFNILGGIVYSFNQ
ncbi:MAG TPA: hypothetical protein VM101_02150 [Flavitalea sp.]|nr:hypothetical protein [Flavitalea sp.]